jgi:hypothetical protein
MQVVASGEECMAIMNCKLIAVEGAHCTGKSTLVHAITAYYKSRNVHAAGFTEVARASAFVEQVVIHGKGRFDITAELQLLASQIAQEQLLARYHQLLICDRTVANVLGYSRILLSTSPDGFSTRMLRAMEDFCRVYVEQYDRVFILSDFYDPTSTPDPFRPADKAFQLAADTEIRNACLSLQMPVIDMPVGLSLDDKVDWIVAKIPMEAHNAQFSNS